MQQAYDHDEVRLVMAAPPDAVYAVVADVTRMPELSPEVTECRWLDGATGPAVGARFAARQVHTWPRSGEQARDHGDRSRPVDQLEPNGALRGNGGVDL